MSKLNLSIFNATSNSMQQSYVLFQWPYLMLHAMLDSTFHAIMLHATFGFYVQCWIQCSIQCWILCSMHRFVQFWIQCSMQCFIQCQIQSGLAEFAMFDLSIMRECGCQYIIQMPCHTLVIIRHTLEVSLCRLTQFFLPLCYAKLLLFIPVATYYAYIMLTAFWNPTTL